MKQVVFPTNEVCDVIFLVNTADAETYAMTLEAISSLRESEPHNKFQIILVESNPDTKYSYPVDLVLFYFGDFNYNKALNMAFEHISSDWVYVSNNDVYFKPGWYSTMRYYMDVFDLDSASPRCPVPQVGPNAWAQKKILEFPEHVVIVGMEVLTMFCGWGWIMKRDVLEKIIPMPTELAFWFQDNWIVHQLSKLGYKHGNVTSSHVIHFGQKSYKHIDPTKLHDLTFGLQSKYMRLVS